MGAGSKNDFSFLDASSWLQKHEAQFAAHGIRIVKVRERDGDHPVFYIDLESSSAVGRLCFWTPDTINAEVVRRENGVEVLSLHRPVAGLDDPVLDEIIRAFTEAME